MTVGQLDEKMILRAPRTLLCHVCGRLYGLHSFGIHIKQCKKLWIAREALKDVSERKKVPRDPDVMLKYDSSSLIYVSDADLAEINRLANEIYNTVSLSTCLHCGRSFLSEKLIVHNRSCTFENPGRPAPKSLEPSDGRIQSPNKNSQPKWGAKNFKSTELAGEDMRRSPIHNNSNANGNGSAVTGSVSGIDQRRSPINNNRNSNGNGNGNAVTGFKIDDKTIKLSKNGKSPKLCKEQGSPAKHSIDHDRMHMMEEQVASLQNTVSEMRVVITDLKLRRMSVQRKQQTQNTKPKKAGKCHIS